MTSGQLTCRSSSSHIRAGQNERLEISFFHGDATIDTYAGIGSIEMGLSFLDPEGTRGNSELARTDSITVLLDNGDIVTK